MNTPAGLKPAGFSLSAGASHNDAMRCPFCGAAAESLGVACPFCNAQMVLGDRYEIRTAIGQGGMGQVFLAYDRRLANDVAVKRLTPQLAASSELRESLAREARILARLSHESIVRLFDLAEFAGELYLILEYVCGPSLRDMLRAGYRASPLELARIMEQVCGGLGVAHSHGVIHRDLKPSNLLIDLPQGRVREMYAASQQLPDNLAETIVKISDFGIANAIASSKLTLTNAFSGTPGYAAPEQFSTEKPGPETDVYALGAITYELLTGGVPQRPLKRIATVHPAVTEVVTQAMSPARANRFPSAAAFYDALCNAIEGRSPKRALRPARPAVRPATITALVMAFVAVVVTFTVLVQRSRARDPHVVFENPFGGDDPVKIEWRSLPRISELPPPVAESRALPASTGLTGPSHPKMQWKISLPVTGTLRILAVASDGTIYADAFIGQVLAVRDGKVLWAYKVGMPVSEFSFDDAGRIWFKSMADTYCLNRDGHGGRVAASLGPPPSRDEPTYSCALNHTLWSSGWKLDLDGECVSTGVSREAGGPVYAATDMPQVLAVSRRGDVEWTYTPACTPSGLIPTLAGRVVFACTDHSLHGLTGRAERWSVHADGKIDRELLADAAGSVYYSDSTGQSGLNHVHSVDAVGNERWKVDLRRAGITQIRLGEHNRIYVSASLLYAQLICLSD